MRLLQTLREARRTHDPLIEVRISKQAIEENYCAFARAYPIPLAPVLKSNAYGHGLLEIADILVSLHPPLIVVDSIYEAQLLRRNGVRTPLLIIGYTRPEAIRKNRLRDVAFTITSLEGLRALALMRVSARVHIKFDTGMRRQGLLPEESDEAMRLLRGTWLQVEGVCSHFADADGQDEIFTRKQILEWNELVPKWREAFPRLRYWHLAATAGAAFMKDIDANMMRLGTGLYGFPRHALQTFDLMPALSMHSVITGIKDLAIGESVGYNCTFRAKVPMRIATVPAGYFEGVDRRLSSAGSVLVEGVACSIVGRVSMNITIIDVSNCPSAQLETPVMICSDKPEDPNSLVHLADICKTTPLELLVHIPQHLRRRVM